MLKFKLKFKGIMEWLLDDLKYYLWYGPICFIKSIPIRIKWWYQRRTTGFDDWQICELYHTITEFMLPRLKSFRFNNVGCPTNLTEEKWDKILESMINAFELIKEDKIIYSEEEEKVIEKGLNLFRKWFFSLWI